MGETRYGRNSLWAKPAATLKRSVVSYLESQVTQEGNGLKWDEGARRSKIVLKHLIFGQQPNY